MQPTGQLSPLTTRSDDLGLVLIEVASGPLPRHAILLPTTAVIFVAVSSLLASLLTFALIGL